MGYTLGGVYIYDTFYENRYSDTDSETREIFENDIVSYLSTLDKNADISSEHYAETHALFSI